MKHKLLPLLLFSFFVVIFHGKVKAQTGRLITLKEAIELSIKNSNQLKFNQAKIEEATAALREAVERKWPDASLTASHLRIASPNVDIKIKSSSSSGNSSQTPTPSSVSYGIANVSLPLYAGHRIRFGIESGKYLEQAAQLDAENQREAVILNTIEAFENLYKAHAATMLVKENLEGTHQRVKDFGNLEKNGILARNELLKVQLQESNTELSLLDAENNWRLANINMSLMLGLPDTTVLQVNEADLQPGTELKTIDEYVQHGLQNRKDIEALGYRKKAAAVAVKSSKTGSYPQVALTGGYIAADVASILTVTNAINIGLGVQYNIASLWKNGTVDQAKAREKQLLANEAGLQDAVRLDINRSYQNFLLAKKRIEVYDKAIVQAEENNKIVKNKFSNTLATTTDLLDADIALLQVRLNAAFAKADAAVAYNKLLQAAGLLH